MAALRDDELAGLKCANAVLRTERDAALTREAALAEALAARSAELARCNSEYGEAAEQQAATAEILQIINTSPGDLSPVFDAVLERAMRLCEAAFGSLYTYDGERFHSAAQRGVPAAYADFRAANPPASQPGGIIRRVLEANRPIQVLDVAATDAYRAGQPSVRALADLGGAQTNLLVPLRKDEAVLGVISIYRQEVRAFSDRQIALLENFAAQAVIAMENARLLGELQQRTSDLQESLEYQTATGDVLKVISQSTFDLPPVLETLLETAARLCNADLGAIAIREGDVYRMAASYNPTTPEYDAFFRGRLMPADRGSVTGRTVLEGRIIHVADVTADPDFALAEAVKLGGARTVLGVPLLREGAVAGVIILGRKPVQPFADRQIELVATFADQAVIAIENTRLLTEQREALEQQTATAEVLQVINSSPGNLEPVFEVILEKAHSLCGAAKGAFVTFDGQHFQVAATRGLSDAYTTILQSSYPDLKAGYRVGEQSPREQLLNGADLIHLTGSAVAVGPVGRAAAELEKIRALLFLPLRRDGALLGYITAYGMEESTFCDKQIALLKNFAAQAVIAMENARLITETREALEQQTATAEVLQVINSSPGDLRPVFDAMLERAMALCEADYGHVYAFEDGQFSPAAIKGDPGFMSYRRQRGPLRPQGDGTSALERLIAGESVVWAADVHEEQAYRTNARFRELADSAGIRSMATIALRKEDSLRGAIIVYRRQVRPFSQKQIALLRNFAEQAVIAMENARLITETREALEQQTATTEVLQVINASPGNVTPVFEAMLEKAIRLCGGVQGALWILDGERVKLAASRTPPEFAARLREHAATGVPEAVQQTMRSRLLHIPDFLEHELYLAGDPIVRAAVELGGFRSWVGVALVKDDAPVGAFVVGRRERRPFTEKQIALLQNFAAQAVIAMENARLITETREALAQQTATTEVLQVINSSPGDLEPVFETLLDRAMRLCGANFGEFQVFDGERLRLAAFNGVPGALAEFRRNSATIPTPGPTTLRMRDGANVIHTADLMAEDAYREGNPHRRALVDLGGARTVLAVALRKDDTLLGAINIYRQEVRPFSDRQVALLQSFAAQAIIAMENARLLTETREALEQQTATAEVLGVINSSPGNLAPVFDGMLEKAMRLCGAAFGSFYTYDCERLHSVAQRGVPPAYAEFRARNPIPIRPGSGIALALAERRPHKVLDLMDTEAYAAGEPAVRAMVELGGVRTLVAVPLCKDETVVGLITICRQEIREFSSKQIALLENFAAQAVIAMENARLLDELRQRTQDLGESLEYQTATSEVLKAISQSAFDLQPMLDALVVTAARLCNAEMAGIARSEGEGFRLVVSLGIPDEYVTELHRLGAMKFTEHSVSGRAVRQRRVISVSDASAEPDYPEVAVRLGRFRSSIGVPLLRDGDVIGVMTLARQRVESFTDRQIELVKTFADQAVIAMENARLLTETREALEQQTATAEILGVINASPGDLGPVFDTMLDKALDLCGAAFGNLWTYDGQDFHPAAVRRVPRPYADALSRGPVPGTRRSGTVLGQIAAGSAWAQVLDAAAEDAYLNSRARAVVELGHARSVAGVALRKEGGLVGAITVYRQEVRPFSDKQIALLESFAAQAVIAMENARLLTETREALEQQTATAEVLQVINASPGNLEPVFDAILEKALHLCESPFGLLATYDDEFFHTAAQRGLPQGFADLIREPFRPHPGLHNERLVRGEQLVHISDITGEEAYRSNPTHRALADQSGARTAVWIALRRDDTLLGVINIYRQEVRPFSDRQIELLRGFAAQAVIAIDNARLITETREALAQQTATSEVLRAISASPDNAQPVFELIARRAKELSGAAAAGVFEYDGALMHHRMLEGYDAAAVEQLRRQFPRPPGRHSAAGRAVQSGQVSHIRDTNADPDFAMPELEIVRSLLGVPLLHEGRVVGAIALARSETGGFGDTQVALVQSFAEQAVIAINSAETYRKLQERTAALAQRNSEYGERIEQQTATIDVLKAMSASPDDTQPVFDQIVNRAQELCNGWRASLFEFDGELVHHRAYTNANIPELDVAAYLAAFPMAPTRGSITCRAILDRQTIHIRDMDAETVMPAVRGLLHKSQLTIPLLRDNVAIGAITLAARERGGFSDSQVALLQTFAEQAVIAITSVANFRALRERTAELSRSVAELQALEEVLRAVNSSLELETVLSTIINRAVQLSDADEGTIYEFDKAEKVFVPKAACGMSTERVEWLRDRRVRLGETHLGRAAVLRAPVHIEDVQQEPTLADAGMLRGIHAVLAVPLLRDEKVVGGLVIRRRTVGGFAPTIPTLLQTFAGQAVLAIENARLFQEARQARVQAETTLADLRRTQDRLVQSEKMASLGQLTAGIAHEIKNPLNFVNNFSELSADLLDELHEAVAPDRLAMADNLRTEIDELTATLKGNLEKIAEHGRRADSIVKNMLLHSRSGPGEHRMVDLNSTVEEALNLAYHGARAATPGFNITMEKRLDPQAGMVDMYPQEITRVLLNLIGNGFYAAHKRAEAAGSNGFEPTLRLTTRDLGDQVEIRVRDNGTGISEAARDRIFEPFFTTKPAGEGTGLGLSLSYEIIVQQHGGRLTVDSEPDAFTEFVVTLPRKLAATNGGQA